MSKPRFVYVTYIATTPEKLWRALTDAEITKDYWFRRGNVSDWKVGSTWEHRDYDERSLVDIVGKVLESRPPRRLVISWGLPAEAARPERRSRVAFDIEPFQGAVRLTVTHDELEADSEMLRGITKGWPLVLASLKTLLETGQGLEMARHRSPGPPE